MEKIFISQYDNVKDPNAKEVELHDFFNDIKNGRWQDQVLYIRNLKDKDDRRVEKQKCPLVTISGSFHERKDAAIRKHSGFIAIDIDNIPNAETAKDLVSDDPYVYAAFLSISGKGVCLIFRIDHTRHTDAFDGICAYLYDQYQLVVDQTGRNVSRARFISYDPHIIINEKAQLFKKYPKKELKKKPLPKTVFVQSDFDRIVNEMVQRGVNICEQYSEWLSCAFALARQFGEAGRHYFHMLSAVSVKYNEDDTNRQYSTCLAADNSMKLKQATIASIYHQAKLAGIEIYSEKTKEVIRSAASQKRAGVSPKDIARSLQENAGIQPEESNPIIEQVITNNIKYKSNNLIDDVVQFLKPYKLRKNLITRNIEWKGKPIDDSDINSIYLDAKVAFEEVSKDLICAVLFSNRIESYNPIHQFFAQAPAEPIREHPNLNLLLSSIKSDTENYQRWITKWLVSAIASAYGKHSPLVMVLCGEVQGTGKTHFYRYLLPQSLQSLFAESKMDGGKDDEILMTKKWIILDDEYGGKSKREEKKLKEITSKQWINIREPYGRVSVDLRRLSVFCGTSNEVQILNDPTGNRRIIPIHIIDIDKDAYNQCNKEALWRELHALYHAGYDYTILAGEIIQLNANTEDYKQSTAEEELIASKLSPEGYTFEWLNITQIIQYLIAETKYSKLSNTRIGIILNKLGYEKKRMKMGGTVVTAFKVCRTYNTATSGETSGFGGQPSSSFFTETVEQPF